LNEEIIKSIERRKDLDPNWWRVYGLGEVGNIETLVFWNWDQNVIEIHKHKSSGMRKN